MKTNKKSEDGSISSKPRRQSRKRSRGTGQESSTGDDMTAGDTTEDSRNRGRGERKYGVVKEPLGRAGRETQRKRGNAQRFTVESSRPPTLPILERVQRWVTERERDKESTSQRKHAESTDAHGRRREAVVQPRNDKMQRKTDVKKELEEDLLQCVVCMDQPRKMLIRPCNHFCVCQSCVKQLQKCPICKCYINKSEIIFNV